MKLNELTQEQQAKLVEFRADVFAQATSTEPADRARAIREGVEYLTTREVARMLGVTMEKVQEMARRGVIKGHKAGELAGMRGTVWRLEKASVDAARKATDRVMSEGPREVRFGDRRLVLGASVADTLDRLRRAADFAAYGGCHFEPEPDLATRLLPFEDVDEHRIWPIGVYEIGNPGPMDWEAKLTPVVRDAKSRSIFSYYAGTRAQAVEACRCDLRLRLKAVKDLEG